MGALSRSAKFGSSIRLALRLCEVLFALSSEIGTLILLSLLLFDGLDPPCKLREPWEYKFVAESDLTLTVGDIARKVAL